MCLHEHTRVCAASSVSQPSWSKQHQREASSSGCCSAGAQLSFLRPFPVSHWCVAMCAPAACRRNATVTGWASQVDRSLRMEVGVSSGWVCLEGAWEARGGVVCGNWWHWQEVGDTSCHQLKVRGGISLPTLRSQVMPMHSEHEEMRYGSRTECDSGCNCLLCYLRCHKETEKHETRKQRMWDTCIFV